MRPEMYGQSTHVLVILPPVEFV